METIESLAKTPFDLRQLTPERLDKMRAEACGLKLIYGTQRVTEEVVEALWQMAMDHEVLEKMEAMQRGEIVNYIKGFESEERAALHTALRDLFGEPLAPEVSEKAQIELDKLDAFIRDLHHEQHYTDMIFIGIGGSELGPKMLYEGLGSYLQEGRKIHFVSSVDPDDVAMAIDAVELERTLVVVVSKSGGTMETATNEALVRAAYDREGISQNGHFVAATGSGSPMDDPDKYREIFYIWDFVGGRYSATSVIGGIALAFAFGMEILREFLRGAHEMDRVALERDPKRNVPLMLALMSVWNRNYLKNPTVAIIPYSRMLSRFSAHIQQVEMESNGKRIDKQGRPVEIETAPIIWGEPGTNAQHSFFQLIHQGTDVVPLECIGFTKSQCREDLEVNGTTSQQKLVANLFAQVLALATGQESANPNKFFPGNRPTSLILGERLDPYTLGALLALYEHRVVFEGFMWGINSFDQEGVQLGKVLANRILERMEGGGEPYPLGDALLREL